MRLLDGALHEIEATGALYSLVERQQVKEELLRVQGANEKASEYYFLQALAVARRQEAKSLELRAAMSLCRLWRHQGRLQESSDLLAEIYAWFTEGFNTHALVDARLLLEQLS